MTKRIIRFIVLASICITATLANTSHVSAGNAIPLPVSPGQNIPACVTANRYFLGFTPWDSYLPRDSNCMPRITSFGDVWIIAFAVAEDLIIVAGYGSAGFIIWGFVRLIKGQGEPAEVAGAKTTIQNAIIGLVVAVISVAIVRFVANGFSTDQVIRGGTPPSQDQPIQGTNPPSQTTPLQGQNNGNGDQTLSQ
jgi:hypothetical protein